MQANRQEAVFRLLALAGLVLAVVPVLWPLLSGQVFAERDLITLHWPNRALLLRAWAEGGGLPTWNPYQQQGLPLAANPHYALWHPLTWLFLVLPFGLACNLQVLLPLAATALGMFHLLRIMGRAPLAAIYGCMVWSLGGVALSLSNLLPVLFTLAPLPWAVACTLAARRAPGVKPLVGLAVAIAFGCAGGEPVSLAILAAAVLVVSLAGVETATEGADEQPITKRVTTVVGAGLLGCGLAAIVLLPASELFAQSARARSVSLPEGLAWSLAPARLLELVVPPASAVLGEGADSLLWSPRLYGGREPLVYSLYLGCLLPGLVWVGLRRMRRAWAVLAVGGLVLSLGASVPLAARIAARLPLLGGFRFPEKWLVLSAFVAVVGASRGFDALTANEGHACRSVGRCCGAIALIAGATVTAVLLGWPPWVATPPPGALSGAWQTGARLTLAWQMLLALGTSGVVRCLGRGRRGGLAAALIAISGLDLAVAGRPLLGFVPRESLLLPPEFLRPLLATGGTHRIFHAPCAYDVAGLQVRSLGCPPLTAALGVATSLELDTDRTQPWWASGSADEVLALRRVDPTAFAAQLARRGIDGTVVKAGPGARDEPHPQALRVAVLPLPGAQPDVFCPQAVVGLSSRLGWREVVRSLGPAARTTVVLEPADANTTVPLATPCVVHDVAITPGAIEFSVDAPGGDGTLVAINSTWHPGWRATCGGATAPILRADLSLMALVVPPGCRRVSLRYRDVWLDAGAVVSASSAGVAVSLLLVGTRRRTNARRSVTSGPRPPTA